MAAEHDAEAVTADRPPTLDEQVARLHAEWRDINIKGDNLDIQVHKLSEELRHLDGRRSEILKELRSLVSPAGSDVLRGWEYR